jgi:hypothetical protein
MEATKGKTLVDRAYETTIDILQNHNPYPLPVDARKEMSKIVKEFEKELKWIKK